MKSFFLSAFLLFFASAAHAQKVAISSEETDDSSIIIAGKVSPHIKHVWVKITKPGIMNQPEDVYPVLEASEFSQKIYLRHGAGNYRITVFETEHAALVTEYKTITSFAVENKDLSEHNFLLPSTHTQSDSPRIILLAQKITNGIGDQYEQSKAIHNWVAHHIAYDINRYLSKSTKVSDALETLQSKKGVCEGYARLSMALHRAVGIPVRLVFGQSLQNGESESHSWTEVWIEARKRWISEDATWDAGTVNKPARLFVPSFSERFFDDDADDFKVNHLRGRASQND